MIQQRTEERFKAFITINDDGYRKQREDTVCMMIRQKCQPESDKPGEAVCDFPDHRTAEIAKVAQQ